MSWEYRTVLLEPKGFLDRKVDEDVMTATLNELGADGWELATGFDTNVGGMTRHIVLILKRPKQR